MNLFFIQHALCPSSVTNVCVAGIQMQMYVNAHMWEIKSCLINHLVVFLLQNTLTSCYFFTYIAIWLSFIETYFKIICFCLQTALIDSYNNIWRKEIVQCPEEFGLKNMCRSALFLHCTSLTKIHVHLHGWTWQTDYTFAVSCVVQVKAAVCLIGSVLMRTCHCRCLSTVIWNDTFVSDFHLVCHLLYWASVKEATNSPPDVLYMGILHSR